MRSAMDALSDSIRDLEESGRWMLAEIERLKAERNEALAAMSADTADVVLAKCVADARIDAALALHHELQGYCRTCGGDWPCTTVWALRGEK